MNQVIIMQTLGESNGMERQYCAVGGVTAGKEWMDRWMDGWVEGTVSVDKRREGKRNATNFVRVVPTMEFPLARRQRRPASNAIVARVWPDKGESP